MDQLEASRIAGKVNRAAINFGFDSVEPGIRAIDLDEALGKFIRRHDCEPAFLGYQGFPMNACICINNQVVHGIAGPGMLKEGDILTIDIGTKFHGWCTDAAETRIVGSFNLSPDHKRLIVGSNAILDAALKTVVHGVTLHEIAIECERVADEFDLNVFPDLGGHQIGKSVHEGFCILHTTKGVPFPSIQMLKCTTLQADHFICIEPIVTLGEPTYIKGRDGWTLKSRDGAFSAQQEAMVMVTEDGYELLS